ncbi:hypothetical protein ACVIEM_006682 [Rhizobium leguminosarum]
MLKPATLRTGLARGSTPEESGQWTTEITGIPASSAANRTFELKAVRGIDFRIGLGVAWSKDDPTASRDDIVDIARSLAWPGR